MKRILLLLFVVISFTAQSQITRNQSYDWRNLQIFSDSVRMDSLTGSGSILKITDGGVLYRGSGTQDTLIDISQVVGLQDSLASRQKNLTLDSNFVFQGDTFIQLNDTIWVEVGKFIDEVQVVNSAPRIYMQDNNASADNKDIQMSLETGELRLQYLNDAGSGSGDYALFNRSGNNMLDFSLYDNDSSTITLKNSGTGVFEDTVRSGQLKVAGVLYPTSDGTNGQVLTTNGSGVATFQDASPTYVAGTNITISNDTISATSSGDGDWTINGNYVYNLSDSIGIGVSDPDVELEVNGRVSFTNANQTLTVTNTGGSAALTLVSSVAGDAMNLNNHLIDSVSNDVTLADNDQNDLVTEYAVKQYVDERILNDTRVSWAADVDTSARVDGFVLKWNAGAGTHYYDTAGTGGGGSTYFRGQGLTLSANTFAIGDDSVTTAMLQDDAVTYSKIQNVGGNSVLARAASGSGNLSEVSLSASQLLGRGSSGNISAISLSGLTMVGTTLTNSNTGTVTNVASGNGMNFSSITTTGTVTLGTPSTLTGSSTNSVGTSTHAHQLDFATFKSNSYGFFLDTTRTTGEFLVDSGIGITTEEKVILFTMSEDADSVLLGSGYFTMSARVVINAVNNDTLSGVQNVSPNLPKYTIKAYLVDDVQTLGSVISGSKTELRTARVIDMFTAIKNGESTSEGIITMTMNTNPTKFRITDGFFVAVTISATYGGVVDYVKHEDASMVIEKANDYDGNREQVFD